VDPGIRHHRYLLGDQHLSLPGCTASTDGIRPQYHHQYFAHHLYTIIVSVLIFSVEFGLDSLGLSIYLVGIQRSFGLPREKSKYPAQPRLLHLHLHLPRHVVELLEAGQQPYMTRFCSPRAGAGPRSRSTRDLEVGLSVIKHAADDARTIITFLVVKAGCVDMHFCFSVFKPCVFGCRIVMQI
jgi:hypothetical protein